MIRRRCCGRRTHENPTIAIVDAGMSGMAAAMEPERPGVTGCTVVDKASEIGVGSILAMLETHAAEA